MKYNLQLNYDNKLCIYAQQSVNSGKMLVAYPYSPIRAEKLVAAANKYFQYEQDVEMNSLSDNSKSVPPIDGIGEIIILMMHLFIAVVIFTSGVYLLLRPMCTWQQCAFAVLSWIGLSALIRRARKGR